MFSVLWFVSYVMSGLQCKCTDWPKLLFSLVLGSNQLLWGKEAKLNIFALEYNTPQHRIGLFFYVHMEERASVVDVRWVC